MLISLQINLQMLAMLENNVAGFSMFRQHTLQKSTRKQDLQIYLLQKGLQM